MTKNQNQSLNIPTLPRISIFDKKANNQFGKALNKDQSTHNQKLVNTPQFRINQHKGA